MKVAHWSTLSESQRGIGIGIMFCVMAVANALNATPTAASVLAMGQQVNEQTVNLLYFTIGALGVLHVMTWFAYAALVGVVSRFVFSQHAALAPLSTVFATAGTAQLPLVVWALVMAGVWMAWSPTTPQELLALTRFQLGSRAVAYFCALMIMTYAMAARYQSTASSAIVVAWTPALTLWVLSILVAMVAGVTAPQAPQ